jgi:DNA-binding MarR family transcriptional regulator
MTTSTVLRTLQQKGFIARQEHATDTRAKVITLTPEGKKIIKKAVVTVEKFDKDFFSQLGNKTAELNGFLQRLLLHGEDK